MVYYHLSVVYYNIYNREEGLFFSDSKATPQNRRKKKLVLTCNLSKSGKKEQKGERTIGHFYRLLKKETTTLK